MSINQNKHTDHSFFMSLALAEAQKNLGNTNNNPSVGCIITKNNTVISAGSTSINGRPHAELNAINNSLINLRGSNLYVTLEPCSHFGETPPCINSIIRKKIKRVFFSVLDSDLRSYNQCSKILRRRKIFVNKGVCSKEADFFYRSYTKSKSNLLPFVTSKLAVSRDFFTINKKREWITNEFSRARVHLLRSQHDCLLTSYKTVLKDNPRLTCRINGLTQRSPIRTILDKKLETPLNSKIFKIDGSKTIIFYNHHNKNKIKKLNKLKVRSFKVPIDLNGDIDLIASLIKLKELGFSRIFLESGLKLTTSFLEKNLVDDFSLFISNKELKDNGKGSFRKCFKKFFNKLSHLDIDVNLFGEKLLLYKLK